MFVFKAAVVGAGTMGGQIAQTIAASGTPVVLKDVKDELVQAGLDEARNVTRGQVKGLVEKGRLTEEQAAAQVEEVVGRIHGATTYDGFGDVDFVIEALPERMEIKQAVFAELAAVNFAQAIRKQPITCAEVPGFVVNRILNSGIAEIWREQEEKGLSIKRIDEGVGAANVVPMGPYFLVNLLGLDTVVHVAEHLHESYGDRFYVPEGMQRLVAEGKLGAKTGGDGVYTPQGEPAL